MSKIALTNVTVITGDADNKVLTNSALAIAGGKIIAVGSIPEDFSPETIVDGKHRLVALSGFFNCHTHAAMTLLRGWAEDLPVERWLNEKIWPAEKSLSEDDIYYATMLGACEMIRGGTVAFADHYFSMHRVAQAVEEAGLKALLASCVFDSSADAVKHCRQFVSQFRNAAGGRIKTILGPHSAYACCERLLREIGNLSREMNVGCHIHVAETPDQVSKSKSETGKTPVRYLADLGIFDVPSIAAHTIHVNADDIEILKQKNVTVVHCPKTHLKMGMGTTAAQTLLSAGVNVTIGTDGCASNNNLDMLESMRLASLSQKHEHRDPTALPQHQALRLATPLGAQTMGFANSGTIAEGNSADLILVDMDKPHLTPCHDPVANIVFSALSSDVAHVICQGRFLMKDRELLTVDEERVKNEAGKRALRMVAAVSG